jgi:N-acetylglucosamine-6-sulfatase
MTDGRHQPVPSDVHPGIALRRGRNVNAVARARADLRGRRTSHRRVALGLAAAASLSAAFVAGPAPAGPLDPKPNVVFIVTDDQRWDTLWAMPTVQSDLVDHGVRFRNAFVTNPLCCPSRATILTGEYSHSTGVYSNMEGSPYAFSAFDDSSTLATWLHDGGYRTGLFGKYLNGYPGASVPPGWDRWFATRDLGFYDYPATDDGVDITFGSAPEDYETTVLASRADEFIRSTPAERPLFAYITPHAPHDPATPAPGDEDAFSQLPRWRPPSYNEADVSDKPVYIRRRARLMSAKAEIDQFRLDQYRSLLAVDRLVGTVVQALRDTGRLADTMIVFTSDNGILWGEHRWRVKNVPYEESIRVPMVIRYDPITTERRSDGHIVGNVDLAPTAASLAGAQAPGTEGLDLLALLRDRRAPWRHDFLLEHMSSRPETNGPIPSYCGVRASSAVYVYYKTGEEELYDLTADPYELQNVAADPARATVLAKMRTRVSQLCQPPPPGLTLPAWPPAA